MRCQTGYPQPLEWALLCLLLLPYPALAALPGSGACPVKTEEQATVLSLDITGTDLVIQLAATPELGGTFSVSLSQPGGLLGQQKVAPFKAEAIPAVPFATTPPTTLADPVVVLPGVMAGAEIRDIRYWITVYDSSGQEVMAPFPFSILYDCPRGGGCSYYPLAGVSTSGLLVTEDLYAALGSGGDCDMVKKLERLRATRADLAPDISTLFGQLYRLGITSSTGKSCAYAWLTVVPIDQGYWESEWQSSALAPAPDQWEFAGGSAGASLCYTGQARSLGGNHGVLTQRVRTGRSALTNEIRCVQGGVSCANCPGTVVTNLAYHGCAIAEAQVLASGFEAVAETDLDFGLEVNGETILQVNQALNAEMSILGGKAEIDGADQSSPTTSSPAPMRARMVGMGTFLATTGELGGVSPVSPTPLPKSRATSVNLTEQEPTTAFAYSDAFGSFSFQAVASSQCTLKSPIYSILKTPEASVVSRSGGIKIKRWADPPP